MRRLSEFNKRTAAEIEALLDAELGSTDWKTGGIGSSTLGTSKFDTEKLWHDGRTIYGKLLRMTPAETETFLNTNGNTFAHGENLDRIISYSGNFKSNTGEIYVIPFAGETGAAADDFTTYNINFNSTNLINQSFNNGTAPLVWSSNISDGLDLYMEWVESGIATYTAASDTFESGQNSSQMILSNSDVTATSIDSPSYERAATFSFPTNFGLYYIEFDYDVADSGTMIGVGNQSCDYTSGNYPGGDPNSVGIWRGGGGDRYTNGVASGFIRRADGSGLEAAAPTTGDREAMAIDTNTGNIWYGVVSGLSVIWFRDVNNNVSDPVAGTNPHQTLSGTSYRFMAGDGSNGGLPSFSIVPASQRIIW